MRDFPGKAYRTNSQVLVDFSTNDGKSWRLNRPVYASVVGHYLPSAAGSEQKRARWDGKLTLLGVKLIEIEGDNGILPECVEFDHEHKEYWGFHADDWQDGPLGVTAHINHTNNEFPPDTVYEPA